jgi:hypothetical protein
VRRRGERREEEERRGDRGGEERGEERIILIVLLIYWVELSDMWICGCCNSKFLQFPREEIRARVGVCFVGDTYFLFHSSNLRADAIELSGLSAKHAYGKV